jgi:hypothetical protein
MNLIVLLTYYNYAHSCIIGAVDAFFEIYDAVMHAFEKNLYVLFEGRSVAYSTSTVNAGAPSSAKPLWFYDKEVQTFVEWSTDREAVTTSTTKKSLSALSLTIMNEGEILHDLTDFVSGISVQTFRGQQPSVAHILAAWALSSKIVLDRSYEATIITDSADFVTVSVESQVPLGEVATEQTT